MRFIPQVLFDKLLSKIICLQTHLIWKKYFNRSCIKQCLFYKQKKSKAWSHDRILSQSGPELLPAGQSSSSPAISPSCCKGFWLCSSPCSCPCVTPFQPHLFRWCYSRDRSSCLLREGTARARAVATPAARAAPVAEPELPAPLPRGTRQCSGLASSTAPRAAGLRSHPLSEANF